MLVRTRMLVAGMLVLAFGSTKATGTGYSIDAHVLATGSSTVSTNGCLRLQATIAEPSVGFSTNGGYAMKGGFAAIAQSVNDDIFSNGFEGCAP